MAACKDFLDFIMEQLSGLDGVEYRAMMGEYIIYYHGKIVGGIYDDRFLVKMTPSSTSMMPQAQRQSPYEGAKQMLVVDDVENRTFLENLLNDMFDELPEPKRKR